MISEVFRVCDAYEAGYGKGQVCSPDLNPYSEGSKECEAWGIGYQKAIKLEADQFETLIHYPEHWDTAVYPTLGSAVRETLAWAGCSACKEPEVYGLVHNTKAQRLVRL